MIEFPTKDKYGSVNRGPKTHTKEKHKTQLTREALTRNTRILCKETCPKRLDIMEALYIKKLDPQINKQTTGTARTLKLGPTRLYA